MNIRNLIIDEIIKAINLNDNELINFINDFYEKELEDIPSEIKNFSDEDLLKVYKFLHSFRG